MKNVILKVIAVIIFLTITYIQIVSYNSNPNPSIYDNLATLTFFLPFLFMGWISNELNGWLKRVGGKKDGNPPVFNGTRS